MIMIKRVVGDVMQNISEAKEKITMAYKLREEDKMAADWYREMAATHLQFNVNGQANITRLISEAKTKAAGNPMIPGMVAVYEDLQADITMDTAQVQAMIAAYK